MKKILKIALVLTTLALFSTACSNVKSTNLIGTYKNGNYSVTVEADGSTYFRYTGSTDTATMISMSDADYSSYRAFYYTDNNIKLIPWDLTSEKASYEYTNEIDIPYYDIDSDSLKSNKLTMKLTFKKDNESIKCDANWTLSLKMNDTIPTTTIKKTFQNGGISLTKQ
ncbi:hypothetical protein BFL38_09405 [Brachyspira hampsonii]|uniref:Uncharacterized protein n=1 Tax=Brachyspira hampsonii TaxID=1287055 RepID=A0A1E5NHP0_9SPIR|nr:hypothetical protein [Brachyspira hampsonii]OEJ15678.1 hypothetical protein BFL38_09405 [Brachyspira hampsonii]